MTKIIEAGNLPLEEKVFMKKSMFGWRIVHPIKNENGKINWVNLLIGGYENGIYLLIFIITILVLVYSQAHDLKEMAIYVNQSLSECHRLLFNSDATINSVNWSEIYKPVNLISNI